MDKEQIAFLFGAALKENGETRFDIMREYILKTQKEVVKKLKDELKCADEEYMENLVLDELQADPLFEDQERQGLAEIYFR